MLVGERDGKVLYYRNDSTPKRANFTDVTKTLRDDRYRTSQVHGYSKPSLIDLRAGTVTTDVSDEMP